MFLRIPFGPIGAKARLLHAGAEILRRFGQGKDQASVVRGLGECSVGALADEGASLAERSQQSFECPKLKESKRWRQTGWYFGRSGSLVEDDENFH